MDANAQAVDGSLETNVTIDDASINEVLPAGASIVYSPPMAWFAGASCSDCSSKPSPEPSRAFHSTWHATLMNDIETSRSLQISFNGTAIFVYFITTLSSGSGDAAMGAFGLEFQLDNDPKYSSSTSLHPNIAVNASYSYGNSLYRATGLAAGIHHLNINSSQPRSFSYIFFDYAIITTVSFVEPSSSAPARIGAPSRSHHTILVSVSAVAGFVLIASLTAIILFLRKRRRRAGLHEQNKSMIAPFTGEKDATRTSSFRSIYQTSERSSLSSQLRITSEGNGRTTRLDLNAEIPEIPRIDVAMNSCSNGEDRSQASNQGYSDRRATSGRKTMRGLTELERREAELQHAMDQMSARATTDVSSSAGAGIVLGEDRADSFDRENRLTAAPVAEAGLQRRLAEMQAEINQLRSERDVWMSFDVDHLQAPPEYTPSTNQQCQPRREGK